MTGCTRRAVLLLAPAMKVCAQPARTLSTRLLDSARGSVAVLVVLSRENRVLRTASAFQLDESADFISTADALRNAVKVIIATPEGRRYPVDTVLLDSAGTGLARLSAKVPEYARRGVNPAQNIAGEEDRVFVACLAKDGERLMVEGVVAAFRTSLDFGPYYRVSLKPPPNAVLEPALPVVNTAGELIGVLTRRLLGRPNLFFVIPARRLPRREDMPPALPPGTLPPGFPTHP